MSTDDEIRHPFRPQTAWLAALLLCAGCARPLLVPDQKDGLAPAVASPPASPGAEPQRAEPPAETPGVGELGPEEPRAEARREGDDPALRERIVETARRYLGKPFRGDCSGFVKRVLADVGVRLPPAPPSRTASEGLWLSTRPTSLPQAGDLAFFHDTYDRNRDGRLNDPWSHVAIVESVEGDQITLVHRGGGGIARVLMDLRHPSDPERNSGVRVHHRRDPPGTLYLAGELSAGFSMVVPLAEAVARRRQQEPGARPSSHKARPMAAKRAPKVAAGHPKA